MEKISKEIIDGIINYLEEWKQEHINENFYNSELYVPDGEEDFEEDDEFCREINQAIDIISDLGE